MKYTKEYKNLIVSEFLSGKSKREVAELAGCSFNTCNNILQSEKINRGVINKYQHNENYFDVIDTEDKAYWLGFITADGCVYKNTLNIKLCGKDSNHLSKFLNCLSSNGVVQIGVEYLKDKEYSYSRVKISSNQIVSSLANVGILPKKSFTVKPYNISNDLKRHYWRGVVDGDGSLGNYNNKNRISLVGNLAIVNGFSMWINTFCETKAQPYKKCNIFCVNYAGNILATKIISELYRDCTIYLDRKMSIAKLAIGSV